jgi:hypothetical protein
VNLGSFGKPIYHGGGWLPSRINWLTRVLTPHIYASTGTWANHTLSWDEVLVCYDAPDGFVNALEPYQKLLDKSFFDELIAGKCLKVGYKCLTGGGAQTAAPVGLLEAVGRLRLDDTVVCPMEDDTVVCPMEADGLLRSDDTAYQKQLYIHI